MNENMKAMGESLKPFDEGPNLAHAEAAKKPEQSSEAKASTSSSDPTDPADSPPETGENSDREQLLGRPKTDEKKEDVTDDTLLDEISKHLEGEEETSGPLPAKLAEIIDQRWHFKLAQSKLTEKLEKYPKPENCKKLYTLFLSDQDHYPPHKVFNQNAMFIWSCHTVEDSGGLFDSTSINLFTEWGSTPCSAGCLLAKKLQRKLRIFSYQEFLSKCEELLEILILNSKKIIS